MAILSTLPKPESLQRLLTNLFNRNVTARSASPAVYLPKAPSAVAAYLRDDGAPGALWACELNLAVSLGAALTLIPPEIAAKCVQSDQVTGDILDNLSEVFNVGSGLFNLSQLQHVILGRVHLSAAEVPADVINLLQRPRLRLDLEMTITGYKPGKMAVLMP